jgi:hypothetical protein
MPLVIRQATLDHSWSKPRTIIRRLTTKFNPRVQTSSPVVSRFPAGPNAFSKENREAALRERGLLPPLPNRDLSSQEREQDKAIPIVLPKDDQLSSTETGTPSAADLIKREWEAKNRSLATQSDQLQRMNSFKFGRKNSVSATPVIRFSSSESAESAVFDSTQALSSLAEVAVLHSPLSTLEAPLVPSAVPTSSPGSRPVTPLLDIPPEIAAYLFSLPPSPGSKFDSPSCPPSPTAVPLPPSPSLRSVFDTTSLRSANGARTPGPLDIPLSPTSTPPIVLTPCAVIISDATNSPLHKQADLSASLNESAPSCQTPSLDSNSHTTTDSTLGTSESAAISGKGRLSGLKIKTHEGGNDNIPVIVESPIEDSFLEEGYVPTSSFDGKLALGPMTAPVNSSEPRFILNAPRMNKRGVTDPTNGNLNRKRSIISNPFKRGLSSGYEDQLTPPSGLQKRLTVKTSLSNMGRSVVGTLSRRTSPDRGGKIVDASHPSISPVNLDSPTSPCSGTEEEVRRAVSPIVYSRGHILMEASHIKDEESRRVTEMAFLT